MKTPLTNQEAKIRLREAQLKAGHSRNTRKQYRGWIMRYRAARIARRVRDPQGFLDHLATVDQLNPKTIKVALNALVFYHREVLGITLENLRTPKVCAHRNLPVFLTHDEAMLLFSKMSGLARLQAELQYGTGSRIRAMLTLRLKDLDFQKRLVHFRDDKGRKSRTVAMPEFIMPRLQAHVAAMRLQWEADHADGIACPAPEPSLMRKLGRTQFTRLPWYWLFPSAAVRGKDRWHATGGALARAIQNAADAAGITKRVTTHALRHSYATALLDEGVNIRAIQKQLGHAKVETTEIYTHVTGGDTVRSPLDRPALREVIAFPSAPGPAPQRVAAGA